MIGNDVVDLRLPGCENKHLDSRFMERVFSPRERELIFAADQPDLLLWQLWAAKEAAFKLLQRQKPELIFAHALFEVWPEGRVEYEKVPLAVNWEMGPGWVHAVCTREWSDKSTSRVAEKSLVGPLAERSIWTEAEKESIHSKDSSLVRWLAKDLLRELGVPPTEIIRPRLASGALGAPQFQPPNQYCLSLSHDGDWIAVALARD